MTTKKESIVEQIKAGKCDREIAETVGCTPQYVKNIACEDQLELSPAPRKPRLTSNRYPLLARLIQEEYIQIRDMGQVLHLSSETVRDRIKRGWNFPEEDQLAIQRAFFPEVPVDKLFGPEDDLAY